MAIPVLHPFIDLEETDRAHWLTALFDSPGTPPPFGVRYPVLRVGESPYTWLRDQFQKARESAGKRDRIRRSVVEILVTEAGREPVRDRAQILGQLLEIAGACGFTTIAELLRGWVRADAYAGESYRLGQQAIPIRRTVWSILIAWRKTGGLRKFLQRDFSRPELGSQQLCFVEMGRIAPGDAIRRIPEILDWPERYWREALSEVLASLGARGAVSPDHRRAWTVCMGDILFHKYKADLLTGRPAPLRDVFLEAGIFWSGEELSLTRGHSQKSIPAPSTIVGSLSLIEDPKTRVEVNRKPVVRDWDNEIVNFSNQSLAGVNAWVEA